MLAASTGRSVNIKVSSHNENRKEVCIGTVRKLLWRGQKKAEALSVLLCLDASF